MKALDNGKFMLGAPHGDGEVGLLDIRHAPGDHNQFSSPDVKIKYELKTSE
jgi:hypothetical protein